MTPKRKDNVIIAFVLCLMASLLKGVGIAGAILIFICIIVYNVVMSKKDIKDSEHQRTHKVVWSRKYQKFIEIPNEQTRWE